MGDTDLDLADGGRFTLRWRNTDPDGNVAALDPLHKACEEKYRPPGEGPGAEDRRENSRS
jgi:hypothetical protein